jgi:hypothetical protein
MDAGSADGDARGYADGATAGDFDVVVHNDPSAKVTRKEGAAARTIAPGVELRAWTKVQVAHDLKSAGGKRVKVVLTRKSRT